MPKQENDQRILELLTKMYVDIFEFADSWELPNAQAALVNFSGREMKKVMDNPASSKKMERKSYFSIDTLTQAAIMVTLRAFQIGRYVNNIREQAGRQRVDWYKRIVEEDYRENSK